MKFGLFVLSVICLIFFSMTNARAFYCENETVSIYDTMSDVQKRCGEPFKTGYTPINHNGQKINAQTWYYNCGDSDFVYAVIFVNGKVAKTEAVERGSGKSQCTVNR